MVSLNSVFYGGTQVPNPSNIVSTSGSPTTKTPNTRLGYLAVNAGTMYGLVSQSGGTNVWAVLGGGSSDVNTLTPNSGTSPVVPTGGTISVLGTGSLTSVGGTNSLTLQLTGLTNHALLVGAGTATMTKLPLGSAGQALLSGGASADPSWSTNTFPSTATAGALIAATASNVIGEIPDVAVGQVLASGGVGVIPAYTASPSVTSIAAGNITVSGNSIISTDTNGDINLTPDGTGDIIVSKGDVGGNLNIQVTNTDNTNSASMASFQVAVGGASAGDPYIDFLVSGAGHYALGIDNSASDNFVLSASGSLGTSNVLSITSAGALTSASGITATTGQIIASAGSLFAGGDEGTGIASTTAITNVVETTQSSGSLTISSTNANSGANAGFIKAYVGTQVVYIPYFTNIAP